MTCRGTFELLKLAIRPPLQHFQAHTFSTSKSQNAHSAIDDLNPRL